MILIIGLLSAAIGVMLGFFFARATSGGRISGLNASLKAVEARVAELKNREENLTIALREEAEKSARYATERTGLEERLAERKAEITQLQEQMTQTFEQAARRALAVNAEAAEKGLDALLKPVKERFAEFQKKVDESFGAQMQQQRSLKEEIGRIVLQADSLTKALKGDVKAQGNWGEVMLERILEDAGLQKPRDYVLQGEGLSMKAGDGSHQKPDVIINLPNGSHVVVDSKVSLTHYERFCAEEDGPAKATHLKQFIDSTRRHVSGRRSDAIRIRRSSPRRNAC